MGVWGRYKKTLHPKKEGREGEEKKCTQRGGAGVQIRDLPHARWESPAARHCHCFKSSQVNFIISNEGNYKHESSYIMIHKQLHINDNITPFVIRIVVSNCLRHEGRKIPVNRGRGQTHTAGSWNQLTWEMIVEWMTGIIYHIGQLLN